MNKIELTDFSIRVNGKKVSKRQAIEMYGEEKVTRRLNEVLARQENTFLWRTS